MADDSSSDESSDSNLFADTMGSQAAFLTSARSKDPYQYQVGFGNRFASEAIPGTLPTACNTPQRLKYDLYSEQINGTAFVSSRATMQHAWLYRILPSCAHERAEKLDLNSELEGQFSPSNENVEYVPDSMCWSPFPFQDADGDDDGVDFVEGLRTVAGNGDSTMQEGLAIHIYTANKSMRNRAFCSNDGDMLILPQHGRLDIRTEFGRIMVRPGELAVIQAGIRFSVALPDGPVRGYIQEVFGSHYELPELGPLGCNGMALPRDFEHPVASFDLDRSEWEIVYKLAGRLWASKQDHTPFDVVAWHGNYVPYKYCMERFVNAAFVDRDQADPTLYTVLTAKSRVATGASLTDFIAFTPKWNVTTQTFRPPYYHRNMATEIMGVIYGQYGGSSKDLRAGGLSLQPSFMPHGETGRRFLEATRAALRPERVGEGSLFFMFHVNAHCAVTKYALERSGVLEVPSRTPWENMKGHLYKHIDQVNQDLRRMGLDPLGTSK